MAWVVDTCLLLDIGLDDPQFAGKSEQLLDRKAADGLVICPVTFVELAPAFGGQTKPLEEFLLNLGIECREDWTWEDTKQANAVWSRYVQKRPAKQAAKRPVADVLIGAFASRFKGLLTRNSGDFSSLLPKLKILEP
jgi:predicted nucleic acid-binding protein